MNPFARRLAAAGLLLAAWLAGSGPAEGAAPPAGARGGMILIPAGSFLMGRNGGPQEEAPAHEVHLPAFHIDRNLVTWREYARFIQAKGPAGPKGEMYLDVEDPDNRIHLKDGVWAAEPAFADHPAGELAWHGAVAYCAWAGKKLPSEAEWEKAARGTDGRLYPWGNQKPTKELAFLGFRGETGPVGRHPRGASPYGVLDMAGQVWEWTRSLASPYPYNPRDGREDLSADAPRVIRGGMAGSDEEGLTSTSREVVFPPRQATGHAYIGFRCVRVDEAVN